MKMMLAMLAMIGGGAAPDAAMGAWMQCLANSAARFAATSEPAETAADAAMGACSAEQGALEAAERRGVSGAARRHLLEVQRDGRETIRRRVIARVVELRSVR